jgi:hypothetical protein
MSEQKRDLQYYIDHPDEFPTEPEAAAKLMKELEVEEIPGVLLSEEKPGEKKPGEEETKPADKKPDDAEATAPPGDKKPDGVLAKDGKHVIPYAEMERRINEAHSSKESEAAARKAAEDYAKELEAKLTAAQAETAKLKGGAKPADKPAETAFELPSELMETLRADFPTHAKAIEALQSGIKTVVESNKKLRDELDARIQVHDRDRNESVQSDVETLIDGNADLKAWRSKGGLLWDAALSTEDAILGDSKFLKDHLAKTGVDLVKDDKARYEVVAARVKQELGLPATASPKDETKDLTREADEKVSAAQPAPIRSLSDIRGGGSPAVNLEDNLENVTSQELAARLMNMTEDQRARWLERVS